MVVYTQGFFSQFGNVERSPRAFLNGKFTGVKSELEIFSVKKKGIKTDQMS